MRIPVYKQKVDYHAPAARDVALARPIPEAFRRSDFTTAQTLGSLTRGVYELPAAISRGIDAYKDGNKKFKESLGKITGKKEAQTGKNSALASPRQGVLPLKLDFSSPLRAQLLDFGRHKLFDPGIQTQDLPDAVSRLDEYFGQVLTQPQAQDVGADGLLAQDFAVMRREVQTLEEKNALAQQKEAFEKGAGHFVQTAGMVRTPRALEAYISANLQAAAQEARASGLTKAEWKAQKETLFTRAVGHNIEAALAAGETAQAEKVWKHFENTFPANQRDLVRGKIETCQAGQWAEQLYPAFSHQYADREATPDEKTVYRFLERHAPQNKGLHKQTAQALLALHAGEKRRESERQLHACEELLAAQGAAAALARCYCKDEQDLQRKSDACRLLAAGEAGSPTDRSVFNTLYDEILRGAASEKRIDGAFDRRQLRARDYLRLKSRYFAGAAGQDDPREKLLGRAVEGFCRQAGLTPEETAEAKYLVFSGGADTRERMRTARELKEILQLKEDA